MTTTVKSLTEITNDAVSLLYRELGVVNTVRFLMQFTSGYGNYTEERDELFADETLDTLVEKLEKRRKSQK